MKKNRNTINKILSIIPAAMLVVSMVTANESKEGQVGTSINNEQPNLSLGLLLTQMNEPGGRTAGLPARRNEHHKGIETPAEEVKLNQKSLGYTLDSDSNNAGGQQDPEAGLEVIQARPQVSGSGCSCNPLQLFNSFISMLKHPNQQNKFTP